MISQVTFNRDRWIAALMLDPVTGLDPPGVKVRAAEGIDAASSFVQGYWLWYVVIRRSSCIRSVSSNTDIQFDLDTSGRRLLRTWPLLATTPITYTLHHMTGVCRSTTWRNATDISPSSEQPSKVSCKYRFRAFTDLRLPSYRGVDLRPVSLGPGRTVK